uniref:Uncharacterized protein n=1 Tax=Moniliophthora roreri TaxID=221103 RepID=A0A0W0G551_MONRR
MKFFTIASIFLPILLVSAQEPECPPGYQAIEFPPDSDNWFCRRILGGACPPGSQNYFNVETGAGLCCPDGQQLVIYDKDTNAGVVSFLPCLYIQDE